MTTRQPLNPTRDSGKSSLHNAPTAGRASVRALLSMVGIALSLWLGHLNAAEDIVLADFEGVTYGDWKIEGTAFGAGPVTGNVGIQGVVSGFQGQRLVNSMHGGDAATGKLTSPEFKIERKYIQCLIGGGNSVKETCINLLVDGKVVRNGTGPRSETLAPMGWDVADLLGKMVTIQIVDSAKGGFGHIMVDQIVQSDTKPQGLLVRCEKTLTVNGTHLIVPVGNYGPKQNELQLEIYDGNTRVQFLAVSLPLGNDAFWLAAYPLDAFGLQGKQIRIGCGQASEAVAAAFERIKIGAESEALATSDYTQPYRNQLHASTRRGWVNDPNGLVYKDGKYHLYYQYNPVGINWGNMHWGHLESTDLIHWQQKPIAIYGKLGGIACSGSGFIDFNDTAGLGKNTQFAAFTSYGRGQCIVYSKDGGLSFNEIEENPVVKNPGRDPKVIWYEPEKKWVMAVYDESRCAEVLAVPPASAKEPFNSNIAFYESKNLRQWTRTGAFTDPQRFLLMECPDMFELPVVGKPGESRWILLAAANCYFVGQFDGKTFHKESGPHGNYTGTFYAGQVFGDVPGNRRIQIGWVRAGTNLKKFPDAMFNQAFSIPNELTLRETSDGLRVFFWPVKEFEQLRGEVLAEGKDLTPAQANEMLQKCKGQLSETLVEFADAGPKQLVINGIDAGFNGRQARIFNDRTLNDVYADDGLSFQIRLRSPKAYDSTETRLIAAEGTIIRSLKIYRLNSIWRNAGP